MLGLIAATLVSATPAGAQQAICVSSARTMSSGQLQLSGVNNCGLAVHYNLCALSGEGAAPQRFARTLKPGEAWSFSLPATAGQPPKIASDYCRAGPGMDPGACTVKCPTFGAVIAQWVRSPTADDFFRLYPPAANRKGVSGKAAISCTILETGLLSACSVVEETPVGQGFGDAALRMVRLFKARPVDAEGNPTAGATTRIPLSFRAPL